MHDVRKYIRLLLENHDININFIPDDSIFYHGTTLHGWIDDNMEESESGWHITINKDDAKQYAFENAEYEEGGLGEEYISLEDREEWWKDTSIAPMAILCIVSKNQLINMINEGIITDIGLDDATAYEYDTVEQGFNDTGIIQVVGRFNQIKKNISYQRWSIEKQEWLESSWNELKLLYKTIEFNRDKL